MAGWKKFEPLWDFVIRARQAGSMLPALEAILSEFGRRAALPEVKGEGRREKFSLLPSPFSLDSDPVYLPSRYFTKTTSFRFSL